MRFQVTGAYNTEGVLMPFTSPVSVVQLGNKMIDRNGTPWAIKDEYGDWVSPTLHAVGVKGKVHVEKCQEEVEKHGN